MAKIKLTKKEVEDAIKDKHGQGQIKVYKNGSAEIDTSKEGDSPKIGFKN